MNEKHYWSKTEDLVDDRCSYEWFHHIQWGKHGYEFNADGSLKYYRLAHTDDLSMSWFSIILIVFCILAIINAGDEMLYLVVSLIGIAIGSALLILSFFLPTNPYRFEYSTGILHLDDPFGKGRSLDFFDCQHQKFTNHVYRNGTSRCLKLEHKELKTIHISLKGQGEFDVEREWKFICRLMDKQTPLPDVPALEVARCFDPVTQAFDKQHGRPERLWRDMEEPVLKKAREYATLSARYFDHEKTIDENLDDGWNEFLGILNDGRYNTFLSFLGDKRASSWYPEEFQKFVSLREELDRYLNN